MDSIFSRRATAAPTRQHAKFHYGPLLLSLTMQGLALLWNSPATSCSAAMMKRGTIDPPASVKKSVGWQSVRLTFNCANVM